MLSRLSSRLTRCSVPSSLGAPSASLAAASWRSYTSAHRFDTSRSRGALDKRHTVTLIRGEGIGPDVCNAVVNAFTAMSAPVDWESWNVKSQKGGGFDPDLVESINRNKVALKGPLTARIHENLAADVSLAREFGLYAHVVPVKPIDGLPIRHKSVDMVIIRENTEGEYSGLEHEVNPGVVQSIKIITKDASRRIAKAAFEYAVEHGRRKVSAVHKANIMKRADGLFLEACREVAGSYIGKVDYEEVIIDNACMQLVSHPEQYDVVCTPNLYGNIMSEAAAGLAGGVGIVPGYNVGKSVRIFEQGPRHHGLDIADQNKANPVGFLLASALMLRHLNLTEYATTLENAVARVFQETKIRTRDVGGTASTSEFTQAVIDHMALPVKRKVADATPEQAQA